SAARTAARSSCAWRPRGFPRSRAATAPGRSSPPASELDLSVIESAVVTLDTKHARKQDDTNKRLLHPRDGAVRDLKPRWPHGSEKDGRGRRGCAGARRRRMRAE